MEAVNIVENPTPQYSEQRSTRSSDHMVYTVDQLLCDVCERPGELRNRWLKDNLDLEKAGVLLIAQVNGDAVGWISASGKSLQQFWL